MKPLELDEDEMNFLKALLTSQTLNIPIVAAQVAASLQQKIALASSGLRLAEESP